MLSSIIYVTFIIEPMSQSRFTLTQALLNAFGQNVYVPMAFVDTLLIECAKLGASDILFEPLTEVVRVRVRIDGELYLLGQIPNDAYMQISSRIKVIAKLDPTEKRRIQEGQYTLDVDGRTVNLRIEIVQIIHGEMIVVRIHEKRTIVMEVAQLGLNDIAYQTYLDILQSNNGLILVCGPTGSGKSTTLYTTLMYLNKEDKYNVVTVEDPVEFQLHGINQMQTNDELGLTFVEGLRTMLRLTPDIILVGEIRDRETAEIAIESGLTGQLVLSTIHAQDAVGAIYRLLDLGIESYFMNSAILGIVAQRLVRRNCDSCKVPVEPTPDEVEIFKKFLGHPPKQLMKGKGCNQCQNLMYSGRSAIFEVLRMNSHIRDLIRRKVSEDELRSTLVKDEGFITLLQDGLQKCEQGITTMEEVWKNNLKSGMIT